MSSLQCCGSIRRTKPPPLAHLSPSTSNSGEPDRTASTKRHHQRKRIEPVGPVGTNKQDCRCRYFVPRTTFATGFGENAVSALSIATDVAAPFSLSPSLSPCPSIFSHHSSKHGRTERVWFSSCGHTARGEGLTLTGEGEQVVQWIFFQGWMRGASDD